MAEAYQTLNDPVQRRQYDRERRDRLQHLDETEDVDMMDFDEEVDEFE